MAGRAAGRRGAAPPEAAAAYAAPDAGATVWDVQEAALVRSHLGGSGPRYEDVRTWALGPPGARPPAGTVTGA